MTAPQEIGFYSAIWIVLFAMTFIVTLHRRYTVGLTATFLITFLANHWLGSVLYVLPWQTLYPPSEVAVGLRQSLWGMAAFAFGALILTPMATKNLSKKTIGPPSVHPIPPDLPRRIRLYLFVGMMVYFLPIFVPFLHRIPTFNTFVQALTNFTVLAAYLFIFMKMRKDFKNTWWYVVLIVGLFPLIGVIFAGFASFGSVISVLMLMLYFSYNRIDLKKLVTLLLIAYIGLSSFVIYMNNRSAIRDSVWGQESLGGRLGVITDTARQFEFFSIENPLHRFAVDIRLNRNYYVGAAVLNLSAGVVDYAGGRTFLDAFIAPIPRALWPGKPVISGDNTMTTEFTGIQFVGGTSAGSGPLFESYVNFGTAGVVGMFVFWGLLLGVFDARGRRALDEGRYLDFALWSLPLISLMDNVSPASSIIAPMVSTFLVFKVWQYQFERTKARGSQLAINRAERALANNTLFRRNPPDPPTRPSGSR